MSEKFLDRMSDEERDKYHGELFGKEEWDRDLKKEKNNENG